MKQGKWADELQKVARSWLGTPFVPHGAVRGAGVDCVHLCAEIYRELGWLDVFDPPRYSIYGGSHLKHSTVCGWVERSGHFKKVERAEIGDLICFVVGRVEHHVGIKLTEQTFIQALTRYGVIESNLGDSTYQDPLTAVYRPLKLQEENILDAVFTPL